MSSLLAVLVLALSTGPSADRSLCEWMSGAQANGVSAFFANAKAASSRNDHQAAFDGFKARQKQLAKEAQAACFDPGNDKLEQTTKFLDKRVRCAKPVLFPRRDQWALDAASGSWGAYLACKAGQTPAGLVLLRAVWRDWAAQSVRDDMAFLALASSTPAKAADAIVDSPKTVNEMVAKGLFHCRLGEPKAGMSWLAQASAKADKSVAKEVNSFMENCGK